MALVSWSQSSTGSFSWANVANWTGGIVPVQGDDVVIQPSTSQTVGYATGTLLLDSLTVGANATFNVTGGALTTLNGATIAGGLTIGGGTLRLASTTANVALASNVTQSAGNLIVGGGGFAQGGTFTQTGGTLTVNNGGFTDSDSGTLSGSIAGNGRLILSALGTGISIGQAANLTISRLLFQGQQSLTSSFNKNFAGVFEQSAAASTDLNGGTLSLSGRATLRGAFTSGGTVAASGGGLLTQLTLDNGVVGKLTGAYNQVGLIQLGVVGSGTLAVQAASTLRLLGNTSITGGNGVVINNGTIAKVGGPDAAGSVSRIFSLVKSVSTSTITVGGGTTLTFDSPSNSQTSTLSGLIGGAGTVVLETGSFAVATAAGTSSLTLGVNALQLAGSATVSLTANQSYAGVFSTGGGTLVVGSPLGGGRPTLTLSSDVNLETGLLKGTGTVLATGAVHLSNADLEGNLTFNFTGANQVVTQAGNTSLGAQSDAITSVNIGTSTSWSLTGASSLFGRNGTIFNSGTFAKSSGSGTSIVQDAVFSTGTLLANSGTLQLAGSGTLSGLIGGSSVLALAGNINILANTGTVTTTTLNVADLEITTGGTTTLGKTNDTASANLSFANQFQLDVGATLFANGKTLTLNGSNSLNGTIQGGGRVVVGGDSLLGAGLNLTQGVQLVLNNTAEQTGSINLTAGSTAPTLTVGKAGVYQMDAGATIGTNNASPVGTVSVAGTLVVDGTGQAPAQAGVINAAVLNNGSILVSGGELKFMSALSGSGLTSIGNGGTLDLLGNSKIGSTISFGAASGVLELGTPSQFVGKIDGFVTGDIIELQNFNFLNTATPTFSGGGTVVTVSQSGGSSVSLTFTASQTGSIALIEGPHGYAAIIHT